MPERAYGKRKCLQCGQTFEASHPAHILPAPQNARRNADAGKSGRLVPVPEPNAKNICWTCWHH